jgi:hypothetical protein
MIQQAEEHKIAFIRKSGFFKKRPEMVTPGDRKSQKVPFLLNNLAKMALFFNNVSLWGDKANGLTRVDRFWAVFEKYSLVISSLWFLEAKKCQPTYLIVSC